MIERLATLLNRPADAAILAVCAAPEADHGAQFAKLDAHDWRELPVSAQRTRTAGLLARAFAASDMNPIQCGYASRLIGEAAQEYALTALSQGEAIARVGGVMRAHGLEAVGLKGLSLAYRDYPDPAMRPLRDLDLLLDPDGALKANQLLLDHPSFKPRAGVAQYGLEYSHQLPEIEEVGSGLVVELHHRINARGWEQEPQLLSMLRDSNGSIALLGAQFAVPSAHANFLHLVEHATLHHLFANGPLLLSDLHYLAARDDLDLRKIHQDAGSLGLARGLRLVAHIAHWAGAEWVPNEWLAGEQIDPQMIAHACNAMFEDREVTEQIAMQQRMHSRSQGGPRAGGKVGEAATRMLRPSDNQLSRMSGQSSDSWLRWLGYPAWLAEKGARYFRLRRDPEIGSTSLARTQLHRWIKGH